ncbi:MAG TPA: amino acid aminotransferase [Rhabdochlamydiaceae bacterium]|nr:amino acid aminotransferase [Rhabdochlamydiaceae bacterium]
MVATSLFDKVTLAPPDAIFGKVKAFQADSRPNKVNLLVGFYVTEDLKTPILDCVKKAEKNLLQKETDKKYLPIDGEPNFIEKIGLLIFGQALWKKSQERIYGAQTIGGTGALRTMADFLRQEIAREIWISDPTWPNHHNIFPRAGLHLQKYPYYDKKQHRLLFDDLIGHLSKLQRGSVVLLHANCHNPTGFDPSMEEWKILSKLFLEKGLFPFFDAAYQGFGEGLDKDAAAVRYFLEQGHEMAVVYSCAKNFSLYGERVGALYLIDGPSKNREKVESQIKAIIRANYSNPPIHGAAVVTEILSTPPLIEQWHKDLEQMRVRIAHMRKAFITALQTKKMPYDVQFMEKSKGLFCFSGLETDQVEHLIADYGIYLPYDGRINVTSLNASNLEYVVDAISKVVKV